MSASTELWEQIRQRPGMFLGSPSITAWHHFLAGWSLAHSVYRLEDDPLFVPLDFHDWVAYREHFYESTSGWCRMLLDRYSSEELALQRFFELHDEFRQRICHEFAFIESLTRYTEHQIDGVWTQVPHTGRLSLFTYTDDPGFFVRFTAPDWGHRDEFHPDREHWMTFGGVGGHALTITDQSEYDRVMRDASP